MRYTSFVLVKYYIKAVFIIANKIPIILSDKEFFVGKVLFYSFLSPFITFAKLIIGCSKIYFYLFIFRNFIFQQEIFL